MTYCPACGIRLGDLDARDPHLRPDGSPCGAPDRIRRHAPGDTLDELAIPLGIDDLFLQ